MHYRVGATVKTQDGFTGVVIKPLGREHPFELLQAAGAQVTVYTIYSAETGEVRRYLWERLVPITL